MSKQVVLCGSIAYDYLMQFPGHFNEHILPEHIDRLSLSFLVDEMRKQRGGVSANIAYTMGLLGANPLLFGTVGQDFNDYRQILDASGVDTGGVKVIEDKFTASFFVTTDLENRQIASFYAGAMGDAEQLSIGDLDKSNIEFVVISPNSIEAMAKAVRECKELGIPYVYDPGQQTVRLEKDDLLGGLDGSLMLLANDYELSLIEKKTELTSAEIENLTHLLVVTRGEHGLSVITDDATHHIDAVPPTHIADPTGSGDAFRGGFFRAYTAGADLETAGQIGALAATYCLEAAGTQLQSYSREEFIARWEGVYGDSAKARAAIGLS